MSNFFLTITLLMTTNAGTEITQDMARFYEIEIADDPSYDTYFWAGVYRLLQGDVAKSIELFERIKTMKPQTYYYLGVAYYRSGDYDRAEYNFEKSCAAKSGFWQSCYYLSLICLKKNKVVDAMEYLKIIPDGREKRQLSDYISDYEMLNEARNNLINTKYEEAIELYGRVQDFFGYREMGLALAYAKLGEYQKSIDLLDTVIEQSSDEALMQWGLFQAGKEYAELRNLRKAKYYLREYLQLVPDDNAKFLMGRIYSDEAKFDSARLCFKDLPDTIDAFLFYEGRTEYFLGLWGGSEEKLLRHREKYSKSVYADRTLFILASINFKRKDYREAIVFWKALVDSFSHSIYTAAALKEIGNSYFNLGDYVSALNAYKRVAQYHPSEEIISEVSLKIYETKYYLHKYPSLVDALRRYVRENPGSSLVAKTKLRISKILYDNGQHYQSMSELDRIIDDNPDDMLVIEALILRAQVSQAIGNRFELVKSLQALLMNENATEYRLYAVNELGALWFEEMRYDSALHYYNLLLDSDTYRENAIVRIANIYNQLGQSKESIAMIERLITEYPKSRYLVDAYILHARALKTQGDYESAINILHEVADNIGDRAELYMEIGRLYFESEEFAVARQYFLRACEMFKQQRESAAKALLLAGDASVRIGDKTKGKELYLQANMVAESAVLKNQAMQKITMLDEE